MINTDELNSTVRERIERLCHHFFPQGRKVNNQWRVADIAGVRGDSLGIQLTGPKAGLWHDFATGQGGIFPDLLMANRSLCFPDAVTEIECFLGVSFRTNGNDHPQRIWQSETSEEAERSRQEFDWPSCVDRVDHRLRKWLEDKRGFSSEFIDWLIEQKLIGCFSDSRHERPFCAFPVLHEEKVVACHYRIPPEVAGKDGKPSWCYYPKLRDLGITTQPLVIGDLGSASAVHAFESQWDGLAFLDKTKGYLTDGLVLVITRGAENAGRLKGLIPDTTPLYAWPQNDEPGQKWLRDVSSVVAGLKRVIMPKGFKDLNDWTRGGASGADLAEAIKNAEVLQPASEEMYDETPEHVWPVMDPKAFYGLFGQIVRLIEPETEADPAAILAQLLAAFGNAIGRNPFFHVEAAKHHSNLFLCIVGRSAKGRKGTSLSHIMQLLSIIDPDWKNERQLMGLSSGEGVIWNVRDPIYQSQRDKKNGQVEEVKVDNGVDDKRLFGAETEFAQALKVMSRPANILSTVLRNA